MVIFYITVIIIIYIIIIIIAVNAFLGKVLHHSLPALYLCSFPGPCVAGVVGLKKPRFDIFGESVDITRQIEETGTGIVMSIISVLHNNTCDLPLKR